MSNVKCQMPVLDSGGGQMSNVKCQMAVRGWGGKQKSNVRRQMGARGLRRGRKGGTDARRLETKFTVCPWPPGKRWRAQSLTVRERRRSVLWRLDEAEAHLAWN